jgi:hypothetical protein
LEVSKFFKLFFVWNKEELPHQWKDCVILSVYDDEIGCSKYLGISLLWTTFFHFGEGRPLHNAQSMTFLSGGDRPLYKIQFLIFRNPLEILVARFENSDPKAFLSDFFDVHSILRRSCHLLPGFLMPLLRSGNFQRLFPNVCPFRLLNVTSSLFCPLRHATPA